MSVGDVISAGQDIVEMETDKATVPVPSDVGGKVTKILVGEGDTVPIGGGLLEVEAEAGASTAADQQSPAPSAEKPAAEPEPEPEPAAEPEPEAPQAQAPAAAPPQAAPAAPTTPAPVQPAPAQPAAQSPPPAPTPAAAPATPSPAPTASSSVIPAGPAIRRFAREVGVDLASVPGSGEGGRITRDDVLAVVRSASQKLGNAPAAASAPAASSASTAASLPGDASNDEFGPVRVEKMSKIRKTIARQMHTSWSTVPRVTNFDDADITDLERLRQSSKEDYAAQGLKLTTMPFLIKAIATALRHHPAINAIIDEEAGQVVYKDYVNVGIAVDTDRGLVVPVMQDADRMGIPEITRSLAEMAGKVRSGQFGMAT